MISKLQISVKSNSQVSFIGNNSYRVCNVITIVITTIGVWTRQVFWYAIFADVLIFKTGFGICPKHWFTTDLAIKYFSDSSINPKTLRHFVIFSRAHASTIFRDKCYDPTIPQCYDHLYNIKLLPSEVSAIEEATRGQSANELWLILRNRRLTSSKLRKILHRRQSTNPRFVRDIMGYSGPMKCLPPQIWWGQENEEEPCKC